MPRRTAILVVLVGCLDPREPGVLVPATVADDPTLPAIVVEVGAVSRRLHVRESGPAGAPLVLVIPGVACDTNEYTAFEELSDAYHVALVDLGGNGLSERVGHEELRIDDLPDEILAIRDALSGGAPTLVVGHSWSAAFAIRHAAEHPEGLLGVVAIEPPALTPALQAGDEDSFDVLRPEYLDLLWADAQSGPADHAWVDWKLLGALEHSLAGFHCDPDNPPPWPVARPGALALVAWQSDVAPDGALGYDFTAGGAADVPTLLLGSSCSRIGADFQASTNLPLFPDGRLVTVEGAGHRMTMEQPEAVVAATRAFLEGR